MKKVQVWAWVLPLMAMFLLQPTIFAHAADCGERAIGEQYCMSLDNDDPDNSSTEWVIMQETHQCVSNDAWESDGGKQVGSCDPGSFSTEVFNIGDCYCPMELWWTAY